MGIACLTSPRATLACEVGPPFHVPLAGERQYYYETLGALEFFKVRNIEGWLESDYAGPDAPLRKADLTLRKALTGEIVKKVTTDSRGYFHLADVPPGSYVLHIAQVDEQTSHMNVDGDLLVDLRAGARLVHLPLLTLSMSDCGMIVHKRNDENSLNQKSELPNAQTN